MNVTLINCYSDRNKGDLGIILATIGILRRQAPGCRIRAVSSFMQHDPWFASEHAALRPHVDELYPAVVGRLYAGGNRGLGLLLRLLREMPKVLACLVPAFFAMRRLIFDPSDLEVCALLRTSDLVISKGGSFLCSEPGSIGAMRLVRELCMLGLALNCQAKTVLWGQSLGPVHSVVGRRLMNSLLHRVWRVVLREPECLRRYPYLRVEPSAQVFGHDLAFSLTALPAAVDHILPAAHRYIGLTVKRLAPHDKDQRYTHEMATVLQRMAKEGPHHFVIIPHVTIDPDLDKALELYRAVDDALKPRVHVLTGDYSIEELLGLYKRMDLLLGTRLHSTIFAMVVRTPVVNLSYHGTKAEGIFMDIGNDKAVLEAGVASAETIVQACHLARLEANRQVVALGVTRIRADNERIGADLLADLGVGK